MSDEASEAEDDRSNGYKSERDAQEGEVPKQKEKTRCFTLADTSIIFELLFFKTYQLVSDVFVTVCTSHFRVFETVNSLIFRLDVWLQEARDQLEELNVRESSECLQETLKDDKLIQSEGNLSDFSLLHLRFLVLEPSQAVAGLTDSQRNKSGLSMGMKDEEEDDDLGNHNASIPHLPKSTSSTGSTISREVCCFQISTCLSI